MGNLGDNGDDPNSHWGVWALVMPTDAPRPSIQLLDALADQWCQDIPNAVGIKQELHVEQEGWDEARLRALCDKHGWEFEWMSEDGERRRRATERNGLFLASEDLIGARQAAEAAAIGVDSAVYDTAECTEVSSIATADELDSGATTPTAMATVEGGSQDQGE